MAHLIEETDAETYACFLRERGGPVILPAGATEQHGPHLPIGTDAYLARSVAQLVAGDVGGLVAPVLAYGYKSQPRSGGGNHRIGTTSLSGRTLIQQVADLVVGFGEDGVRHLVLLSGHYENYQFLYEGTDLGLRRLRSAGLGDVRCMLLAYWDFVDDDTLAEVYPDGFPGWDIEHGGVLETALMLHLHPHLVDPDRAPTHPPANLRPYDVLPEDPSRTPESGCLSSPVGATAAHGALLADVVRRGIAAAVQEEFA